MDRERPAFSEVLEPVVEDSELLKTVLSRLVSVFTVALVSVLPAVAVAPVVAPF
jgi:hypothetical protein